MDPPLYTTPVVGYRRWRIGWRADGPPMMLVIRSSRPDGKAEAVEGPGFYTFALGDQRSIDHEAYPVLEPHGYASTGKPWVPGTNEAVCAAAKKETLVVHNPDGTTYTTTGKMTRNPDGTMVWNKHVAPEPDCHCGLYAMHTIEEMVSDVRGPIKAGEVAGAVVGWGAMEVHEAGWRAQYARVVALACENLATCADMHRLGGYEPLTLDAARRRQETIRALGQRYGVPVVRPEDLYLWAEREGQPLPEHAKPQSPWVGRTYGHARVKRRIVGHMHEVECLHCGYKSAVELRTQPTELGIAAYWSCVPCDLEDELGGTIGEA